MMLGNRWNRLRYGLYAPVYDIAARPLERDRKRATDRLNPETGDHILLIDSGNCLNLSYLSEDVRVTAIDVTPEMVR